jgi:hypothetical protein
MFLDAKINNQPFRPTTTNWNSLLVTAAQQATEPYTVCQKVVINGVSFDSVGKTSKNTPQSIC